MKTYEEFLNESKPQKNEKWILNDIYDKLMDNKGDWNIENVDDQEVDFDHGTISFIYTKGDQKLSVSMDIEINEIEE